MSDVYRPVVEQDYVDLAKDAIASALSRRLKKHGPGAYAGPHETLGILDEEFDELRDAVRSNVHADVAAELIDIAVGCVFGVASLLTLGRVGVPDVITHCDHGIELSAHCAACGRSEQP